MSHPRTACNLQIFVDYFISDYDVFLSPLSDFKKAVEEAGLSSKVVYLDRKDQYKFKTTWTDDS